MSLSTPVIFIIFNRPDLTEIVFQAIRQAKPKKLLVVADGPRFPEEAEKCEQTRSVIKKIDWKCEVLTNFSDKNLGCKRRISSGLDWIFSEVEEAIILEDDCLPTPSFFSFCQTLLEYYRHDERIMMISGNDFQNTQNRTSYSYYFSKYTHIWGWASWKRAWKHYDVDMKTWQDYKKQNLIRSICEDPYEQKYWVDIFDRVSESLIDTWDYQWTYACWNQSGLTILPRTNLVSNLGFRPDATHTFGESPFSKMQTVDIWKINHPPFVIRDQEADAYSFDYVYGGKAIKDADTLSTKLRQYLGKIKQKMKKTLVLNH
ncbi:MAG: glycosyltransferase family 2 protein [Iphinoe sp. HA4291-MV1]|jgi:hypothetical protein|nr:glycosyltransferase family 2 protein [Iphinoe sp. HA4291-MV1]